MKGLRKYLSPFAPDQSGAAAVLCEFHGLIIILDAGGCAGNICGFDEPRWFESRSAIFSAGLRDMDAILGRDDRLVEKIGKACEKLSADFIAVIGTPVPAVIGTDYRALSRMIEKKTGIPALTIDTDGTKLYDDGEKKTWKELFKKFAVEKDVEPGRIGIIGATPLEFGGIYEEDFLKKYFAEKSFSKVVCYGMGDGLDAVREAAAAEDRLINLEEEEESSDKATSFLKMKSGYKKTSDKKRAKQCEEKVKELEEKKEKKNPKKQSSTSAEQEKTIKNIKVNVPVFTSSDEVKRKDCVRELHPQIYPFTEEDGKTEPFKGKLDFSAFTFPEENTSLISEQAQESTLEVQEESYAPPYKEKGAFHTSLPEEIRINEDLGSLIEEVSESIVSEAEAISEENVYPDAADQAIEQKEVPEIEAVKDMKEKQEENEESRIWKNGAEIKQRDTEAKDNASEVNDRDIAIQEKQMARQDTIKKETAQEVSSVESKEVVPDRKKAEGKDYLFPPASLLIKEEQGHSSGQQQYLQETAQKLYETLKSFGVNVTITDISCGPSVTRYEMFPEQGTKVSKILSLTDDIKLNLAASDIRIEAPIPGKAAIGIEIPNKHNQTVHFRDLIESQTFKTFKSKLAFAVGKDIGGKTVVTDLAKMPHLLIAGATGSGKSVCINTLIMSILYKAAPEEVKLIMIDPKMVELSIYNGIPHLLIPVVTDPKKASGALNWAVAEMTNRYKKFTETGVRNIEGYNKKVRELQKSGEIDPETIKKMPQIVIIIDELADLMMVAPGEVEDAIVRLSQLARAAGIHLVIATQRPSVNVITGLIKANVPSRIAFSVSSGVDSRTIIDMNGAEKLLGKGDMLFYPAGYSKPVRVQGAFISDNEISDVVTFLKENEDVAVYDTEVTEKIENKLKSSAVSQERDEYFEAAARFVIEKDKASIGMLQRMFKIGFNRAARIVDQLSDAGIVGPEEGTKPRKVLMSSEQLESYFEEYL